MSDGLPAAFWLRTDAQLDKDWAGREDLRGDVQAFLSSPAWQLMRERLARAGRGVGVDGNVALGALNHEYVRGWTEAVGFIERSLDVAVDREVVGAEIGWDHLEEKL